MGMPGQIEASMVEISELVERISARDAAGAEAVLRAYTALARDSALRQLATEQAKERALTRRRRRRSSEGTQQSSRADQPLTPADGA